MGADGATIGAQIHNKRRFIIMATEKILNTRVQLKYDSYAAWDAVKATFKPLKGEICIVNPGTKLNDASTTPCLMKVGDGTNFFKDLQWVSAIAADVYAWAKKPTPDWTDFPALPITVIDNETGKFVTDVEYSENQITIHRADAANSLNATDDDVVILTVDKNTGDITIDGKHKEYGKAGATTDATGNATEAGSSVTIKVPNISVDKYGHTQFNGETSHTITIPSEVAVGKGDITITGENGLSGSGTFNVNQDTDTEVKISHGAKPVTGTKQAATAGSGRTYVTEVLVDDYGHIAGVKTATESDQDLSNYKIKQTAVQDPTANGNATAFIDSISQDENGNITVSKKNITAEDLGLTKVMEFLGTTSTAIANDSTTNPVRIDDTDVTAGKGDVVLYGTKEFVFDGTKWKELGDQGSHALKSITITGNDGLTGGGDLTQNRTIGIANSGVTTAKIND